MAENDTLLANLIPSVTSQVEVAATKALVIILNKSELARKAFNELVRKTIDSTLEPVTKLEAEVLFRDGKDEGRLDLVGYDKDSEKRVIGEAKFWARLLPGQGGDYLKQLTGEGNAVLMFVVPDARIDYLWGEVGRDVSETGGKRKLHPTKVDGRIRSAKVKSTDQYLMMVSWRDLLQRMYNSTAEEPDVQADIRQLQGLTERMDSEEIRPFGQGELGPDFGRRMRDLRRIYDDVVNRWDGVEWASVSGYGPSRQPQTNYGTYFTFAGYEAWFGVHYNLWSKGDCEDTPFWLYLYRLRQNNPAAITEIETRLERKFYDNYYVPINLKSDVIGEAIVDDIVSQLKAIADIIKAATPPAQPD